MYALVAGGLVSFVEPLAAGSGIAEVKTYLNGVHIRGLLAVRLRAWLGSICMVGSNPPGALCITLPDTLEGLRPTGYVAWQRVVEAASLKQAAGACVRAGEDAGS